MIVGFAIGFLLGYTRGRDGYAISAVLVLVITAAMFVLTVGIIPFYAADDFRFAVVLGITFASPFIGVWIGNTIRTRFADPS
jgi:hypothetical protein